MTTDRLRTALDQLKTLLSTASNDDELALGADAARVESDQRAPLHSCQALVSQIEHYLRYPDTDAEIDALIEATKVQMARFGAEYPKLTKVLSEVVAILGNVGL